MDRSKKPSDTEPGERTMIDLDNWASGSPSVSLRFEDSRKRDDRQNRILSIAMERFANEVGFCPEIQW